MDKLRFQVEMLSKEIEHLRSNPTYQDYLKVNKLISDGEEITDILKRKINLYHNIVNEIKQRDTRIEEPSAADEYEPIEEQPRKVLAKPKYDPNKREIHPEREKELDKKVKDTFEAEPSELGQVDDLELPDIDLEE
jgi:hypothetical protein